MIYVLIDHDVYARGRQIVIIAIDGTRRYERNNRYNVNARCLGVVRLVRCASCVSVHHINRSFYVPVDIQHTQCPCRFFPLERYKLCGYKTTTQRFYIVV